MGVKAKKTTLKSDKEQVAPLDAKNTPIIEIISLLQNIKNDSNNSQLNEISMGDGKGGRIYYGIKKCLNRFSDK